MKQKKTSEGERYNYEIFICFCRKKFAHVPVSLESEKIKNSASNWKVHSTAILACADMIVNWGEIFSLFCMIVNEIRVYTDGGWACNTKISFQQAESEMLANPKEKTSSSRRSELHS